jgi:hypothetical protein
MRILFLAVATDPAERGVVRCGYDGTPIAPGLVSTMDLLHKPFPSTAFVLSGHRGLVSMPGSIEQPPFALGQSTYVMIKVTCKPTAEYDEIATGHDT